MSEGGETEDRTIGGITWHCSEADGGPDVGVSVWLGDTRRLYAGEISDALFVETGANKRFRSANGWFFVIFDTLASTRVLGKCGDEIEARAFMEWIGALVRRPPLDPNQPIPEIDL